MFPSGASKRSTNNTLGSNTTDEPNRARNFLMATRSHALSLSLAQRQAADAAEKLLFAGAGLALLQTVRVAGLAAEVTDGLVEAVGQHGELATVTQRARSAARTAAMLATVELREKKKKKRHDEKL